MSPSEETCAEAYPTTKPGLPAGQAAPLGRGERFGRYRLLERVGRGGMADVYKAVAEGSLGFERLFVVKRIRPDRLACDQFVELFRDEARLSALLHHPNLVQVYEFGQIDGTHFLAMEYLSGKDLASVLRVLARKGARMPVALAAHVAHEVARGLAYAHGLTDEDGRPLEIVHRDVSPANIMLLHAGAVKLVDFGVARAVAPLRWSVTKGKSVKGKLRYMAPEQIRGGAVDGRADVFALGIVLWEMLTGRPLFNATSELEVMRNVLDAEVLPPSALAPEVPRALDAVVMRALTRAPDARHPSAAALADELEATLQTLPRHHDALPGFLRGLFGAPPRESVTPSQSFPALRDPVAPPAPPPGRAPAAAPEPGSEARTVAGERERPSQAATAPRGPERASQMATAPREPEAASQHAAAPREPERASQLATVLREPEPASQHAAAPREPERASQLATVLREPEAASRHATAPRAPGAPVDPRAPDPLATTVVGPPPRRRRPLLAVRGRAAAGARRAVAWVRKVRTDRRRALIVAGVAALGTLLVAAVPSRNPAAVALDLPARAAAVELPSGPALAAPSRDPRPAADEPMTGPLELVSISVAAEEAPAGETTPPVAAAAPAVAPPPRLQLPMTDPVVIVVRGPGPRAPADAPGPARELRAARGVRAPGRALALAGAARVRRAPTPSADRALELHVDPFRD